MRRHSYIKDGKAAVRRTVWIVTIAWALLVSFAVLRPAHASPLSDQFSKSIALEVIDYGYARAASQCHLRSDWWWETMNRGFMDYIYEESFKFKLTDEDRSAAQQNVNELARYATDQAFGKGDCAALVNGPIMKRLDEIQGMLTGGYK